MLVEPFPNPELELMEEIDDQARANIEIEFRSKNILGIAISVVC